MRQRQRQRHHSKWWLLLAGLFIIIVVTLGLIFRGAKVSGPDSASSASHRVRETTPTLKQAKVASGTYTARGSAEDPDGEVLTVRVYLRLLANGHYRRELQIKGTTTRRIVDSGTYSGTKKAASLVSLNAVVLNYANAKAMRAQTPQSTARYGGDHQAYPDYLETVLNNRVTLKRGRATAYRYVDTKLSLDASTHAVPSVATAAAELPSEPEPSSVASEALSSSESSSSSASSSSHESTSAQTSDDGEDASSTATEEGHESALSLADAQAIVAVRYPSQHYQITGGTQAGDQFTFVVTDTSTHVSKPVTVTADGQLQ